MGKDSRAKTAFVTPFGKYEFLQVPFGLAQAPVYFQHLMNQVLDNCSFAMTYLDDIIIFSETEEEHLAHIEEIFKRLQAADLKIKRSKCDFFKSISTIWDTSQPTESDHSKISWTASVTCQLHATPKR